MLDVIVRLFRNGKQIGGKKPDSDTDKATTAMLGKAVLGKMILGKT